MSRIFRWNPTDSVDLGLIDCQHKELLETAEELHEALSRADGLAVAEHVFIRLIDYMSNHFAAEEKLMEQYHYPQLKSHRAEHNEFASKLLAFQHDFKAGKQSVVTTMLPYLQDWIKNHVHGSDHHFGDFIKVNTKANTQAAGQ